MSDEAATQPRARSPRYPGIGLEEALTRARELYRAERRNAAPIDTIVQHWGYKPRSSSGLIALAALKQFGLLDDQGSGPSRRARLTEAALRIILDDREDSAERPRLIKEAALRPTIHAELWQQYADSGLPSDSTLAHTLRWERHFTDAGIREFIRQFKGTVAYAGLEQVSGPDVADTWDDTAAAVPTHSVSREPRPAPLPQHTLDGGTQEILLPVSPGEYVALRGAFPLSEPKWRQMLLILEAMKPALVVVSDRSTSADGPLRDDSE